MKWFVEIEKIDLCILFDFIGVVQGQSKDWGSFIVSLMWVNINKHYVIQYVWISYNKHQINMFLSKSYYQ